MIAGDLRNTLVLITRNGKANDMQTTYSMDILPAEHPVFKPEMIPADFSAFNNFNVARHSYWEKTPEEINAFLTTGQFPERIQTNTQPTASGVANVAQNYSTVTNTVVNTSTVAPNMSTTADNTGMTYNANPITTQQATQNTTIPEGTNTAPTRNFTGFSF
jgi:hypothetical protein